MLLLLNGIYLIFVSQGFYLIRGTSSSIIVVKLFSKVQIFYCKHLHLPREVLPFSTSAVLPCHTCALIWILGKIDVTRILVLIVTFHFLYFKCHSTAFKQHFVQRTFSSSSSYEKPAAVGKIVQFLLGAAQGLLHLPGNCANLSVLGHFAGYLYQQFQTGNFINSLCYLISFTSLCNQWGAGRAPRVWLGAAKLGSWLKCCFTAFRLLLL